jgi:hypothetical protein
LPVGVPRRYENTEPWVNAVPADLIPALTHLRKSFDDAHRGCGRITQRLCYGQLHNEKIDDPADEHFNNLKSMTERVGPAATRRSLDLVKHGTLSAIFKGFFWLYIDCVAVEALVIFKELTEIGQVSHRRLAAPYLEWAEAQTIHLIRSHSHLIPFWIRNVCDVRVHDPNEDVDERIHWAMWQAPTFLVMSPLGSHPYKARKGWDRNDAATSTRWLEFLTEQYVLGLENRVRKSAGEMALELAKKPEPVYSETGKNSPRPKDGLTAADSRPLSNSARHEVRKLATQERYKRWQKEYRELRKRRPEMSDVWYSRQIARLPIGEGQSADTIRKHMTK